MVKGTEKTFRGSVRKMLLGSLAAVMTLGGGGSIEAKLPPSCIKGLLACVREDHRQEVLEAILDVYNPSIAHFPNMNPSWGGWLALGKDTWKRVEKVRKAAALLRERRLIPSQLKENVELYEKMLDKLPYEMVPVPGMEDMKIMVISGSTSQYWNNPSGSKAPWWMISMEGDGKPLMESTVDGYSKFAELYGFHIESSRTTSPDVGNQLFTSAMVRHEDCIVVIPNGGYVADLENKMYKGTCLSLINLSCIGWFNGSKEVYQYIKFTNPYLISITHDLDRVFVRFRVIYKEHAFLPFTQVGKANGKAVCIVDLNKNTAEQK